MKLKYIFLTLVLSLSSSLLFSQGYRIMGRTIDSTAQTGLTNATIVLNGITDTSFFQGTVSGPEGRFFMKDIPGGTYVLKISFVGFDTIQKQIQITEDLRIGPIFMHESAKLLDGVQVDGTAVRIEQNGDTTQYNANAFKTHQDATAEDLLNKLPGISNENGTIKAQGEEVKKVLVDGKPFFGDDAAATLKTIPADMVDKVQVFDKASNQSQFTGYDDGSSEKTINLITKNGGKGQFGKVYAGYGTDDRYSAGGNFNKFDGKKRFTILGMSNNINQQNFTSQDLLGVSSGGWRGPGRGGYGGSSGFSIGGSNGVAITNSFGLNYSNEWNKKWKFTGSYFLNQNNLDNFSDLNRNFITNSDSNLVYHENNTSESNSLTHKISSKVEWNPDTLNEFTLETKFNYQSNYSKSNLLGVNAILAELQSSLDNENSSDFDGYSIDNEISYRRKLNKKGRTFAAELNSTLNGRDGITNLYSENRFYLLNDSSLLHQQGIQNSYEQNHALDLTYTEGLTDNAMLLFSYKPSYAINTTDKRTDNFDLSTGEFNSLDTLLTNVYDNTYLVHRGGIGLNYFKGKTTLNIGVDAQLALLNGNTTFPNSGKIEKEFQNILPNLMYMYKMDKTKSIRVRYRTSTSAPSISQLQEVVDNSNPLLLKSGNANLNQSYTHMIFGRYASSNFMKGTSFFIMMHARLTSDYIGNQTLIPSSDTTLSNGITILKGTQLSRQVNLDGHKTVSSYYTISLPAKKIKSNFSLNGGVSYNRVPALINDDKNLADNYGFSNGASLTSNISSKLDFTIGYNGTYTIVKNSLQTNSDNNYYFHTATFKINWNIWKGLIFNTSVNQSMYNGLTEGFNQNFTLFNAEIGYKFLKEKQLEVKVTAFDILNQNQSISRTVTETYIEDYSSYVLNQYFLVTVTYTLKKVGELPQDERPPWMKH